MNMTLEYTPEELVWIYTALEKKIAVWLLFKQQQDSDLYFITVEPPTMAALYVGLMNLRRIFTQLHHNAAHVRVTALDCGATYPIVKSLDSIIKKIEGMF
jgi:hypothetical protein